MKTVVSLLSKDYSKMQSFELEEYIRTLKHHLRKATIQNAYLLDVEQKMYIKELSDVSILPFNNMVTELEDVDISGDSYAITATIDPKKFPQLILVPQHEQIKYFKRIFSKLIIDGELSNLYGSFETHQNGVIHFHGITYIYNTYETKCRLEQLISSYLTNTKYNPNSRFKNTLLKSVDDTTKWFIYMNKNPVDNIEWKLRKNTLDL